jgi:hypothetical protein
MICATPTPQAAAASSAVRVLCGMARISTFMPAASVAALTRSVLLMRSFMSSPEIG